MVADFSHRPVLVGRVVELLSAVPDGWVVDATLGGGGHSAALLEAHPGVRVLGIDRDDAAITADYIVVEMAKTLLGPDWLQNYVRAANAGGIERVLL